MQNVNCVHFVQNAHSPGVTYYCELGVHFLLGNFIGTFCILIIVAALKLAVPLLHCELLVFVDMEQCC